MEIFMQPSAFVSRTGCSAKRCSAEPGSYQAPALVTAPALQRTAPRRAAHCAASGERAPLEAAKLIPQRAAVLAGFGAAGQRALVPVDPDRLRAAERRHDARGLVADLAQALDDLLRHAIFQLIDSLVMQPAR